MLSLHSLNIKNFKNFENLQLSFNKEVTLLLGSNGAGKSNFFNIFKFLQISTKFDIKTYLKSEKTSALNLFFNWNKENSIIFNINFLFNNKDSLSFSFVLSYKSTKEIVIEEEKIFLNNNLINQTSGITINEFQIFKSNKKNSYIKLIHKYLSNILIFSFYHNNLFLKRSSIIKTLDNKKSKNTNLKLKQDFSNLGQILYNLQFTNKQAFQNIENAISQIIPVFNGFDFQSIQNTHFLKLKYKLSFSKHKASLKSASDGSIRFFSLVTLLSLPKNQKPSLLLLEEPEIGLHPYGINILSDLINYYSKDKEIIVATQSPLLINNDKIEIFHVFNINKETGYSSLFTFNKKNYQELLEHYSLSDLWKMNILGGTPL
jgi:predicted ATPase